MKRIYIKDLKQGKCLVKGYVETIRDQKTMQFLVLRDVSGAVQITVFKLEQPTLAEIVSKLTPHSFIDVEGECKIAPQVKIGGKEILPTKIVVQSIAQILPITAESGQDLRMDYRWIDLRDEKKQFVFKVQTSIELAMREWALKHGFTEIHTPHITAFTSEGGSEVFEIKNYFGQKAYLTQSSQLFKQCAIASGFDRTFEIGPCFRANPSFTSRHDTEFIQVDVEIAHVESHHDVMDVEEQWVKYFTKTIEKHYGSKLKELFGIDFKAPTMKFPRITLLEAYKLLEAERGYKVPREVKGDLDPEGEKLICEIMKEKTGCDFVFVTDYLAKARAFYTMRHEEQPEVSKGFDLLYKGLEVTSGAQREHRSERLKKQIAEKGIDPKKMEFYTQFFEYGCPPHGGFGFGITRFLMKLFEQGSVKDVTFLFRGPSRLAP